jgi:hypothetical protein
MTETISNLASVAVFFACALRVYLNNVDHTTRGPDELWTLKRAALFASGVSFRAACEDFLNDWKQWTTPSPIRFGYLYPLALVFHFMGRWSFRVVTSVSTFAGVASVMLTGLIARELAGPTASLIAIVLSIASPLQLHLGRRALSDQVVCALSLGALLALLTGHPFIAIAALTANIMVKETAPMVFPALALAKHYAIGLVWMDALVFVAPLAIFALVFVVLARSVRALWSMFVAITDTKDQPYGINHQSGPPHRLAVDLFALSPLMCVAAVQSHGPALVFAVAMILTNGFKAAAKNVRMIAAADAALRVSAAIWLATLPGMYAAIACALVVLDDLIIFHQVFVKAKVYDPVSENIFRALRMIATVKGNRYQTKLEGSGNG